MRFIALEEHVYPKEIREASGIKPDDLLGQRYADGLDDLRDGGQTRVGVLDEAGVDMQVLSSGAHAVQGLEPLQSIDLTRQLNDKMRSVVDNFPDRFRFFAALPISDVRASIHELDRCVQELGAVGALVHGQTNGVFLDDPSMRPILQEIERLGVPLYMHPGVAPATVLQAYFSGLDPEVGKVLSVGGWGWHAELGMHVLRLVCNRVFEDLPDLQIIVGHMGENLPFSLARADEWLTPRIKGLTGTVADQVRAHVHITICGYATQAPLLCSQMVMGTDRIMFSTDYPYQSVLGHRRFIEEEAALSTADRERIAHGNAEALLNLA